MACASRPDLTSQQIDDAEGMSRPKFDEKVEIYLVLDFTS